MFSEQPAKTLRLDYHANVFSHFSLTVQASALNSATHTPLLTAANSTGIALNLFAPLVSPSPIKRRLHAQAHPSPGPLNAGKRVSASMVSAVIKSSLNLKPPRVKVAKSKMLLRTPNLLPGPRLVTLTARP